MATSARRLSWPQPRTCASHLASPDLDLALGTAFLSPLRRFCRCFCCCFYRPAIDPLVGEAAEAQPPQHNDSLHVISRLPTGHADVTFGFNGHFRLQLVDVEYPHHNSQHWDQRLIQ